MKRIAIFLGILIIIVSCAQEEEPYFTHLYGWLKHRTSVDTTGVNNVTLKIIDIDPNSTTQTRTREAITQSLGTAPGFFEQDSVCYGTSGHQGSQTVMILADSTQNPGWPTQWWYPPISGSGDTILIYIVH